MTPALPCLTEREEDVVRELLDGGTNKDIACRLRISHETVRDHLSAAYRKETLP